MVYYCIRLSDYPLPLIFIFNMARYIITDTQSKDVIHKYLDKNIVNQSKEQSTYDENSYTIKMYDRNDNKMLYYIWYGPGGAYDDDDDTVHNGIGSLQVHPNLVDFFRKIIKIRVSKILDIISEWVDEQVEDEVDEVTIYPERATPPVY